MKREREIDSITVANCLMLLSRVGEYETNNYTNSSDNRVFECKTCNRKFHSFQALGGHRASHKKLRLMDGQLLHGSPQKAKTHECSICGLEFAIGQALGGHMRRHRAANLNGNMQNSMTTSGSSGSGISSLDSLPNRMKGGNKKRVLVLDLNLTPFENDLEF